MKTSLLIILFCISTISLNCGNKEEKKELQETVKPKEEKKEFQETVKPKEEKKITDEETKQKKIKEIVDKYNSTDLRKYLDTTRYSFELNNLDFTDKYFFYHVSKIDDFDYQKGVHLITILVHYKDKIVSIKLKCDKQKFDELFTLFKEKKSNSIFYTFKISSIKKSKFLRFDDLKSSEDDNSEIYIKELNINFYKVEGVLIQYDKIERVSRWEILLEDLE